MFKTTKNENSNAKGVLTTFSKYGFQKTSMENIAHTIGLSRQSIYNKFGSKEQCYEWTINTYLNGMYNRVFTILNNDELSMKYTLIRVFDIVIGEAIEIVSQAHGTEILDDVLRMTNNSDEDWPLRFRTRLADFLERHNYVSSNNANVMAFALISVGKGLLLEQTSRTQFVEDMTLIIDCLIKHKE